MWSKIGGFFKSVFSSIMPFAKEVAQTATGIAAEEMRDAAKTFVRAAERAPAGTDKYRYAKKRLQNMYPNAETVAINLAIEMAVAILNDKR